MQFQHPEYFLGLAAIPVLWLVYIWLLQWKKKARKNIGDERLVSQLVRDFSSPRFLFKFILIIVAYAAGVLALANPRTPHGHIKVNRNGIDVMIALDVSRSMLAKDIRPTRLEKAKQLVSKLIDKLADDRLGLVVFAGRAYLQMPLTGDLAAAKMYLSAATPEVVPVQGTVIADALKMCYTAFNNNEKKYKTVILITDGEDHDEGALKVTKLMANDGVVVHTVGVGSPEGIVITDPVTNEIKKDALGNTVITKLNESELKNIAVAGNGTYRLLTVPDEAANALESQLQGMEKRDVADSASTIYSSFFQWFAAIAFFLLIAELFVSERNKGRTRSLPAIKKTAAFILLIVVFEPLQSFCQGRDKLIQAGNEAYSKKDFNMAVAQYKKAAEKDTASEKAYFNLGNALYRNGKSDDAVRAYDATVEKDKMAPTKSAAWYNKGVVLQNNNKLPECIEAYKQALRLNPGDEDARLNLQKALKKQQQQQQDQQNKQQQKQQQNQQKQNPNPPPSKMTRKEAEEKLKALLQHEKNLQDKLRKMDVNAPNHPEKDW